MPTSNPVPFSRLGRQPGDDGTGSDAEFYRWIAGDDDTAAEKIFEWLLNDLREEKNPEEITLLLDSWQQELSRDELRDRLNALSRLLPENHVFHNVKGKYQTN